jgi:hypothetical protein
MVSGDEAARGIFKWFWIAWLLWTGLVGAGVATAIYVAVHFIKKVW